MKTTSPRQTDERARLVVACLRVTDPAPAVDPLTGDVRRDWCGARASAADLAALEYALRIAESWAGRVLAIAMGPPAADPVLREARALGADVLRIPLQASPTNRMRHQPEDAASGVDLLGDLALYLDDLAQDAQPSARVMAAAIRSAGEPSLVLCGDRSDDRGTGALPALLAHEFGAAQALGLVRLEATGDQLLAERRLDRGLRERLRVPTPAVCSVEAAGVRLRRATMRAAIASAGVPIPLAPGDAPESAVRVIVDPPRPRRPRARVLPAPSGETRERLLALTGALVERDPPTVIGPMAAGEAATRLLAYLHRHGYLGGSEPGAS